MIPEITWGGLAPSSERCSVCSLIACYRDKPQQKVCRIWNDKPYCRLHMRWVVNRTGGSYVSVPAIMRRRKARKVRKGDKPYIRPGLKMAICNDIEFIQNIWIIAKLGRVAATAIDNLPGG